MAEVAILLATFNSEKYIKELFNSLLFQSFRDFVCYIHDDGSSDNTIDLLESMIQIDPERFIILNYPPTGSAKANFMSMLNYTEEDYVMFCDHDDIWHENKIEKAIEHIKRIESNSPCLVFTDMNVVDDNLSIIDSSFMEYTGLNPERLKINQLLVQNVVPGCTSIMNKQLYQIVRKCDNVDNIRMHDQWAAMVASTTGLICYLNESTLDYRQHLNNVKGADADRPYHVRVLDILRRFKTGAFLEENRQWRSMMAKQAGELARLEDIKEEDRKFCRGFVAVQHKSKIRRMWFYIKNRVFRNKDNMWLLLWC